MFKPNTLFYSDGYKVGHKKMLAEGTTKLYGTWIPRSLKHAPKDVKKIVSFGQQLAIKWLDDEFKENFFKLSETDRQQFFAKSLVQKLGLVEIKVKRNKLDFDITQLIADVKKSFNYKK